MGLLSLIKKFVNEGEVVDEELTGDLAVDPIASYEASTNAQRKARVQNVVAEQTQTVQRTRRTAKTAETQKAQTTSRVQRTPKKVEVQENNEPEL